MIAGRSWRRARHALLVRRALPGKASDRQHTGAEQKLEEGATMVERNDHSISRVLGIDGQ